MTLGERVRCGLFHLMLAPFLQPVAGLREKVALYREALRGAGYDPASREVLAAYHIPAGCL